ncbi:hypothetical protein DTO027I6_10020 [Penicillium roqueforti]|nr:hypothetical protein CBS147337_9937 [Penicillium roqueforti]KAI3184231.1 hypothetical protein DTO027I6_10020 [Penicillium roqueforti]
MSERRSSVVEPSFDDGRIEAPVTWKAYLICAFASFGGIFFGYDSSYINGVSGSSIFIQMVEGPEATALTSSNSSLVVSILSAGTFFGALIGGDMAEWIGRKWTVIFGCMIYMVGVVIQMCTGLGDDALGLIVAGRLVAGFGVGFESAIVILYMSEICPKKIRGALVAGYQFCITIGMLTASCVVYATENRTDTGAYRIPIAIQFAWALVLAIGMFFLPESPRYYVKKGRIEDAANSLARLRGQPRDSAFIDAELTEIVANEQYERSIIPTSGWVSSWYSCFTDDATVSTGAIDNVFLISLIFTLINVGSTPISFYTVERFGRRTILIYGAFGMMVCQFLVGIIGVTVGFNHTHPLPDGTSVANNIPAVNAQIAFIVIFISFFASTWGPGAWIVIGEIFPLPIRSRGVALSTASNWLWNTIIAVITPIWLTETRATLNRPSSSSAVAFVYSYFIIPETKGLSLEQVDKMMEETTSRTSAKWKPTVTFAKTMGTGEKGLVIHDDV